MSAFMEEVKTLFRPHPLLKGCRIAEFEKGLVNIKLDDDPSAKNTVYIDGLYATVTGKGYGSKVLQDICDLADKHKTNLSLWAYSTGHTKIPEHKLMGFYKKFSFKRGPNGGNRLYRSPK